MPFYIGMNITGGLQRGFQGKGVLPTGSSRILEALLVLAHEFYQTPPQIIDSTYALD